MSTFMIVVATAVVLGVLSFRWNARRDQRHNGPRW
jgi:hypothetical protein